MYLIHVPNKNGNKEPIHPKDIHFYYEAPTAKMWHRILVSVYSELNADEDDELFEEDDHDEAIRMVSCAVYAHAKFLYGFTNEEIATFINELSADIVLDASRLLMQKKQYLFEDICLDIIKRQPKTCRVAPKRESECEIFSIWTM